jgi:3-carboxy-cis,cis-muconate cycloisomerase
VRCNPETRRDHNRASCARREFDIGELTRLSLRACTSALPLVQMLTAGARAIDADPAGYVQWGATSQDVADSALVLLLRRCRFVLQAITNGFCPRCAGFRMNMPGP